MNPYYKAWVKKTNSRKLYQYVVWISKKHRQFQNKTGLVSCQHEYKERFLDFIHE